MTQGLEPGALASAVAVGLALGVCPMMGTSTLMCAAASYLLDLNPPAVQLANYLAYPLQIALFLPFVRLGERIFGVAHPLAPRVIQAAFHQGAARALVLLWSGLWHACVAWVLVAPVGAALLALLLRPLFQVASRRFAGGSGPSAA